MSRLDLFNAQNHRVAAGDVDFSFCVDGNSACILLLASFLCFGHIYEMDE